MHEILLYGTVGLEITAQFVAEQLNAAGGEDVNVRINSNGGGITEGYAIYNLLRRYAGNVTVDVDGACFSIATLIALAGDELRMASNSLWMIHLPWSGVEGDADEMRAEADLLDKCRDQLVATYSLRTGISADKIRQMMDAETYLEPTSALEQGFIDAVTSDSALAAGLNWKRFKGVAPMPHRAKKKTTPKKRVTRNRNAKAKAKARRAEDELLDEEELAEDDEFAEGEDPEAMDDDELAEDDEFAEGDILDEEELAEDDEFAEGEDPEAMDGDELAEEPPKSRRARKAKAASYRQIVSFCHGIDPKDPEDAVFIGQQQDARATVAEAQAAWMKRLNAARKKAKRQAALRRHGVGALPERHAKGRRRRGMSAGDQFRAEVRKKEAAGMNRQRALQTVNREHPELRERMVAEANR